MLDTADQLHAPRALSRRDVFVVIAAYNEGRMLRQTVEPLVAEGYSVVVVDDGSTDDTWTVTKSLAVHGVRHAFNLGQGAALQTGMTYAVAEGAEVCVHFDADGQHRLDDLPRLIEPIIHRRADVVLGSRFHRESDTSTLPRGKRWLLRCGVLVNGLMTGMWLTDAHNGLRALSRAAACRIAFTQNGYAHASEILQQIRHYRLRCVEVPTTIVYSDYSLAKGQSMWNAFNIVVDLMLGMLRR